MERLCGNFSELMAQSDRALLAYACLCVDHDPTRYHPKSLCSTLSPEQLMVKTVSSTEETSHLPTHSTRYSSSVHDGFRSAYPLSAILLLLLLGVMCVLKAHRERQRSVSSGVSCSTCTRVEEEVSAYSSPLTDSSVQHDSPPTYSSVVEEEPPAYSVIFKTSVDSAATTGNSPADRGDKCSGREAPNTSQFISARQPAPVHTRAAPDKVEDARDAVHASESDCSLPLSAVATA